jgi:hypothetical protein
MKLFRAIAYSNNGPLFVFKLQIIVISFIVFSFPKNAWHNYTQPEIQKVSSVVDVIIHSLIVIRYSLAQSDHIKSCAYKVTFRMRKVEIFD